MLNTTVSASRQALESTSGVALASNIAELVIAGAILVLAALGAILFWRVNAILSDMRRSMNRNLGPVTDRARVISDNLEYITQSLRTDVEALNASVRGLSDRLELASERMEERIEEFNALMEVVQGEAEEMFLDTAATVRGVREGARAITERAAARSTERRAPAEEEIAPLAETADEPTERPREENAAVHED
jgi:hypothetical protein